MGSEHDDDMDAEVEEGAAGETQQYAVVAEDVEAREAEATAVDRSRELRRNLQKDADDEVEEG